MKFRKIRGTFAFSEIGFLWGTHLHSWPSGHQGSSPCPQHRKYKPRPYPSTGWTTCTGYHDQPWTHDRKGPTEDDIRTSELSSTLGHFRGSGPFKCASGAGHLSSLLEIIGSISDACLGGHPAGVPHLRKAQEWHARLEG